MKTVLSFKSIIVAISKHSFMEMAVPNVKNSISRSGRTPAGW